VIVDIERFKYTVDLLKAVCLEWTEMLGFCTEELMFVTSIPSSWLYMQIKLPTAL